jgi:23S rRNA pseudouridine1911/1915/1917 synthase
MSIEILFEDNHLLAINKPAGYLTQPSGTQQANLETQAKEWIKTTYHKPGQVFLQAVHRLDKPVSGIVLFCRTTKALSRLNAAMRQRQVHKVYYALVEGMLPQNEGLLEHYMIHDNYHAQIVHKDHPQAKVARLSYTVIERQLSTTLLQIYLDTGRYHQIRLQLSTVGCPVLGDVKYGSALPWNQEGIALHHGVLTFPHPITSNMITIECPYQWLI